MKDIRDVAIIGAGPSGLAAAKYLLAEKRFNVQIFEQRASVGGVWNHNSLTVLDEDFDIPRTSPSRKSESPAQVPATEAALFVSPVYDSLETNIPHTLMNFSDRPFPPGTSLFPRHDAVKSYLEGYAEELKPLINFSTQVIAVAKTCRDEQEARWDFETLNLDTKISKTARFDAILVANGHYSDPFIPNILGLAAFHKAHPSAVSHSKFYKNPSMFKEKKVVVVGNSASGIDISMQISKVSRLPLLVSEKSPLSSTPEGENTWAQYKPEIVEFVPSNRSVRFSDGTVETDVDHIVFCTGYFYGFPFLRDLSPPAMADGSAPRDLYQHLLYINDPTLAFMAIPQRIVPFPFAEAQAAWIARLWAGRLPLPSQQDMQDWQLLEAKALEDGKPLHVLKFPKDYNYINMLHQRSTAALPREGLENNGAGKAPPFWDDEKAWTRERFPLIKLASRELGEKRHTVTDLKQLGFDFSAREPNPESLDVVPPDGVFNSTTNAIKSAA